MPEMDGFVLAKEIRKIDDKVKTCFLIAGEIPGKVRSFSNKEKDTKTSLSNYQLKTRIL
jgi:hypothetical protein